MEENGGDERMVLMEEIVKKKGFELAKIKRNGLKKQF